jgi:ubiquitin C-terminal hydrolase
VKNYYLVDEKIIPPARMPERMIVELVRYQWIGSAQEGRREKIECKVNMPDKIKIFNQDYRLKSIVLHTGLADKGHYHTLVNKQDRWWYASDDRVDTAEEEHVKQAAKDGYLYFYEKVLE